MEIWSVVEFRLILRIKDIFKKILIPFSLKCRIQFTEQVVEELFIVKDLYAHSANSQGQRHILSDHLKEVARLTKKFADKFGDGELAYWVGLWLDLGKSSRDLQEITK